jgi:hypothetical protein
MSTALPNRRLNLDKRSQLFIRTHNETLSVAVRVNNEDRLRKILQPRIEAVIRVYAATGNVSETHEHAGKFKEW